MHITLKISADYELFDFDTCDEGNNIEKIQRMFIWSSTNALLNTFFILGEIMILQVQQKKKIKKRKEKKRKENFKHSAKFRICNQFFYKYYLIFKSLYCSYLIHLLVSIWFIYSSFTCNMFIYLFIQLLFVSFQIHNSFDAE